MAGNEVQIILTAVDKASSVLKNTGTETEGLSSKLMGLAKSAGAVVLAYKGFEFLKSTVTDTVLYAESVRNLSRALGANATESSKLIQMADDLKIDLGQLQMAFRFAINKGVDPSISGLKKLSKEYQKIQDPIKKAQFAMENFGTRGGLEMQKVLELTSEELDTMAQSAEDAGLVLTEEGVQSARDFEIAVDDMGDAIEGFKTKLGMEMLPILTDTLNEISEISNVWGNWPAMLGVLKKYSGVFGTWGDDLNNADTAMARFKADDLIKEIGGIGEEAETTSGKIDGIITSLGNVTAAGVAQDALDAVNKAFEERMIGPEEYEELVTKIGDDFLNLPDDTLQGIIGIEKVKNAFYNSEMGLYDLITALELYLINLGKIPRDVTTTYTIHYKNVGGPSTEPGPDVPVVVPDEPYVPNGTQSTPLPTPSAPSTQSTELNIIQNFYDAGAAALGMAYVDTLRGKRLDASMGR